MEDMIEAVIELVGSLLESAFMSTKNPTKRKWALSIFYSVILLAIVVFMLWLAWSLLKDGNHVGAAVIGGIAILLFLGFGALIIRGHKQNWKSKEKD